MPLTSKSRLARYSLGVPIVEFAPAAGAVVLGTSARRIVLSTERLGSLVGLEGKEAWIHWFGSVIFWRIASGLSAPLSCPNPRL